MIEYEIILKQVVFNETTVNSVKKAIAYTVLHLEILHWSFMLDRICRVNVRPKFRLRHIYIFLGTIIRGKTNGRTSREIGIFNEKARVRLP